MPTLTWELKITGADPTPIKSLQAALDALKASAVGLGSTTAQAAAGLGTLGTGAGAVSTAVGGLAAAFQRVTAGLNPAQLAQAGTALTAVGTQADALLRRLDALSTARPDLNLRTLTDDARALQALIAETAARPVTIQTRLETAQAREQLAELDRQLRQLQAAAASSTPPRVLDPAQLAQAGTALTGVGRQVDTLQRQLEILGTARPAIRVLGEFGTITAQVDALQERLRTLAAAPPTIQTRVETAQAREQLADLQRRMAALAATDTPARVSVAVVRAEQLTQVQRQLEELARAHPDIQLRADFRQAQAGVEALQTRLQALAAQPVTLTTRLQTSAAEADLARLQRATEGLKGGFEATGRAAEEHGPKLTSFFQGALESATGFLAANVFERIVGGLAEIGKGAIEQAGSFEQSRIAFTAMLDGNAQAADVLLGKLQAFSNITPFHFQDLQASARELLAMGTPVDQVMPKLQAIATAVAAIGGGAQQIGNVTQALAKMDAEGKVSAIFMNELTRDGIPAWRMLAESMGVSVVQVRALATAGNITADTFDKAFNDYTVKHFGQALEQESQTFQGLLTTVVDLGQQFARTFGGPLIAAIEPTLQRITAALQDPRVLTTLAQWGAAAGQFVNGLIQVGTVAFQVGGEIVAALKPVFDMIGQFFGLSGGPQITMPAMPDFTAAAAGAAKVKDHTVSVKDQIKEAEAAQRSETRAAKETEAGYAAQVEVINEKIRKLQEAYALENRTTSRADLVAKIQKDSALAVDVVSRQGQAAAARLVTEKEQLAAMDRKNAFDNSKAILENDKRSAEDKLKDVREKNAQAARDTQAHVDALRAGAAAGPVLGGGLLGGPPGPVKPNPAMAAASSEYSQFYSSTGQAAESWASKIKAAIADLISNLQKLGGAPGAVLGAVLADWQLLTGAFDGVGDHVAPILRSVDTLLTTLGGRDGLQGVFIAVGYEFQRLMASIAAVTPVILLKAGTMFGEFGSEVNIALAKANEMATLVKFGLGQASAGDVLAAHDASTTAERNFNLEHERNNRANAGGAGDFQARIAAINADINRQQEAAFKAADARVAAAGATGAEPLHTVSADRPVSLPAPPQAPPGQGAGYHSTNSLPAQGTQHVAVTVTVGADKDGLLTAAAKAVQTTVSGPYIARKLGDYASAP